jgi:homoprotocatechuate degradation regulator HpaR
VKRIGTPTAERAAATPAAALRARKTTRIPAQLMSRALPMQLLRAREAVMQRFRPALNELGLTDQQGRIMRALADAEGADAKGANGGALDMVELSRRCCIHPASLSRIVPKLVQRGLLRRRQDARDARRVTVALTRKGRDAFLDVWVESERIYAALAEELGAANLDQLHRCLDALIETLGGPDATIPDEAST